MIIRISDYLLENSLINYNYEHDFKSNYNSNISHLL